MHVSFTWHIKFTLTLPFSETLKGIVVDAMSSFLDKAAENILFHHRCPENAAKMQFMLYTKL